jgi:hypothetical protein
MKQLFTLYVHQNMNSYGERYTVLSYDASPHVEHLVLLGTHQLELEIPGTDANQLMIGKLQVKLQSVRAEAENQATQILGRIQEFQAIGQEIA